MQVKLGLAALRGIPAPAMTANPFAVALAYLLAIALAEILTNFVSAPVGLMVHGALLVATVWHGALSQGRRYHDLLLALTLAPLVRILSLSLPLAGLPLLDWFPIVSLPLFAATLFAARAVGASAPELGLNVGRVTVQCLVAASGVILGGIEYEILRPDPLVRSLALASTWVPVLIILISTGFLEELIFRGLLQRAAIAAVGRLGILYVAVLFAVLHLGWRSALDEVFVFGVGLCFGWIVWKTGSLAGVMLAHGLDNVLIFLVLPFVPVTSPPAMVGLAIARSQPWVELHRIGSTPTRPVASAASLVVTASATVATRSRPERAPASVRAPLAARVALAPSSRQDLPTPAATPALLATALPPVTAVVDVPALNVRSGPGMNYPVLAVVPQRQIFPVVARDPTGRWFEICCPVAGGRSGWVYAAAVNVIGDVDLVARVPTSTPSPREPVTNAVGATIAFERVNVRTGPGPVYPVVTTVPLGRSFQVVGRDPATKWFAVCCVSGRVGWVDRSLLQTEGDVNRLPVKPGPPLPPPEPAVNPRG